jgi:iron complex outermembrane receptor protein
MLFYAKYARGYKQGMVNPRSLAPYNKFGPEQLDTYEAGTKLSWHGETPGYFNISGFYNDFSKQQFGVNWLVDPNNTLGIRPGSSHAAVVNSATSRGYGFELDSGVSLFERLRITGAVAYLNAKLKGVTQPPGPPPYTIQNATLVSGAPPPFAPKWKGSLSARYTLPVPEDLGEVSAGVTWNYSASYYSAQGGNAVDKIDSFDTLNLNLDWKNVGGKPIDIGLFANNVTNEKFYVFKVNLFAAGFVSGTAAPPRMVGAQVKVRFGADAE